MKKAGGGISDCSSVIFAGVVAAVYFCGQNFRPSERGGE